MIRKITEYLTYHLQLRSNCRAGHPTPRRSPHSPRFPGATAAQPPGGSEMKSWWNMVKWSLKVAISHQKCWNDHEIHKKVDKVLVKWSRDSPEVGWKTRRVGEQQVGDHLHHHEVKPTCGFNRCGEQVGCLQRWNLWTNLLITKRSWFKPMATSWLIDLTYAIGITTKLV